MKTTKGYAGVIKTRISGSGESTVYSAYIYVWHYAQMLQQVEQHKNITLEI